MIISGNPVESRKAVDAVLQNPETESLVERWAQSYHTAQRAVSVVRSIHDLHGTLDPSDMATALLDEGEKYVSRAATYARGDARNDQVTLAWTIRDNLAFDRTYSDLSESERVQNHLKRLALINTVLDMNPAPKSGALLSPFEVASQLRNDASATHAGLTVLHNTLFDASLMDKNVMVVHLTGDRASAVAGVPISSGIANLSQIRTNVDVATAPNTGRVQATYSVGGEPEVVPSTKKHGGLRIPIVDLAPVVQLSATDLMSQGLHGSGDFESNQEPVHTVIVTDLAAHEIQWRRRDMFPRRAVVAAMGEIAQKQLGLFR